MKSLLLLCILLVLLHVIFTTIYKNYVDYNCQPGEFQLKGMLSCHVLLTCEDFKDVKLGKLLGFGAVKAVYHAKWKDFDVALSILNDPYYEADFLSGIKNIMEFQLNKFTIQAVGFCDKEKMFLTEFHKNGDASRLTEVLRRSPEVKDNILFGLDLCINYAQILSSLHHAQSADGAYLPSRVLCDSNDIEKLLSQLLLTDDLSLILNDLDAVPSVAVGGIKCGHQELKGNFVAPEQLWKLPGEYDAGRMPGYDEKTDVWKAPSVCNYFLDNIPGGVKVKHLLFPIHERCKNIIPENRPTVNELVEYYNLVKKEI